MIIQQGHRVAQGSQIQHKLSCDINNDLSQHLLVYIIHQDDVTSFRLIILWRTIKNHTFDIELLEGFELLYNLLTQKSTSTISAFSTHALFLLFVFKPLKKTTLLKEEEKRWGTVFCEKSKSSRHSSQVFSLQRCHVTLAF